MATSRDITVCDGCKNQLPRQLLRSECFRCGAQFCGLPVNDCKAICECDLAEQKAEAATMN